MASSATGRDRESGEGPCLDAAREDGVAYPHSDHLATHATLALAGAEAIQLAELGLPQR